MKSAFEFKWAISSSFVEIFEPAITAVNGFSIEVKALLSELISFSKRSPAHENFACWIAEYVEACLRWAVPKASNI